VSVDPDKHHQRQKPQVPFACLFFSAVLPQQRQIRGEKKRGEEFSAGRGSKGN
jgi:hypothetical protein